MVTDHLPCDAKNSLPEYVKNCLPRDEHLTKWWQNHHTAHITILSSLESFRLEADLCTAVALCCFYQQTVDMMVSRFGDAQTILISTSGIFARGKANVRCKVLSRCKTIEIADFCKNSQSGNSFDTNKTG